MRFLTAIAAGIILAILPQAVLAQDLNPCPVSALPCVSGGIDGLTGYAMGTLFPAIRIVFIAVALFQLFLYGFRLVAESGEESIQTDMRQGYQHLIYGCAMMSLATFIVESFGSNAQATLVEPAPLTFGINNIIFYFKIVLSAVVTAVIVTQGIRLIVNIGDESGEKSKAEKNLINAFFGVAAILLADKIIAALFPETGTAGLSDEIRGFCNFMLEIAGALGVLSFIVAGIFLLFSVDESLKDRAKKTMLTCVVAIAIVLSSYILVNYVLSL